MTFHLFLSSPFPRFALFLLFSFLRRFLLFVPAFCLSCQFLFLCQDLPLLLLESRYLLLPPPQGSTTRVYLHWSVIFCIMSSFHPSPVLQPVSTSSKNMSASDELVTLSLIRLPLVLLPSSACQLVHGVNICMVPLGSRREPRTLLCSCLFNISTLALSLLASRLDVLCLWMFVCSTPGLSQNDGWLPETLPPALYTFNIMELIMLKFKLVVFRQLILVRPNESVLQFRIELATFCNVILVQIHQSVLSC